MDITYSNDGTWGSDIGFACDAILNSECSLVGGFFHVATGSGNLWDDIDHHSWAGEWTAEESFFQKVPEPVALRPQTPREQSVSRYLAMSLGKQEDTPGKVSTPERAIPAETNLGATQSTLDETLVSTETKPNSAGACVSSASARPYTPGNKDPIKKPKFFHLGDYRGTRPCSSVSSYQSRQKSPKLPYFPEVMIKMQSTGTVSSQVKPVEAFRRTPAQEIEIVRTAEKNLRKEFMPHDLGDVRQENVAIVDQAKTLEFRQKPVQHDDLPAFEKAPFDVSDQRKDIKNVKAARKPKGTRPRLVTIVKMETDVSQGESSTSARKEEGFQDGVQGENTLQKPKGFHRLGAAVRRLGQSLRSVFMACSAHSRDVKDLV